MKAIALAIGFPYAGLLLGAAAWAVYFGWVSAGPALDGQNTLALLIVSCALLSASVSLGIGLIAGCTGRRVKAWLVACAAFHLVAIGGAGLVHL